MSRHRLRAEARTTNKEHFSKQGVRPVVTTAHAAAELVKSCIAEGIDDYVVKPLRKKTLLPRLRTTPAHSSSGGPSPGATRRQLQSG